MKISKLGLDLIKHYEGLHDGDLSKIGLQPKMCPVGIWTVGYGRALRGKDGTHLRGEEDREEAYSMHPNLNEAEALIMLDEDCDIYEGRINSLRLNLTQYQFDALVSFNYNVGFTNFINSSLYRFIKKNLTEEENILWAFSLYNKARVNGIFKPLPGLTKRRRSEAQLFLTGKLNF